MAVVLEIPDEAVRAMRMPPGEVRAELKKDLAVCLYARGALSLGKSVELAGVTRQEFQSALARRQIERPYTAEDLERDLAWAKGAG